MASPYHRLAMIARWKPVHLGHQAILIALCRMGEKVLIGVGSSNRYNLRNPFTFDETRDMLHLVLEKFDNHMIFPVPDLDNGPAWRSMVMDMCGKVDLFVTENPYVAALLKEEYHLGRPVELIPPEMQVPVDGSLVRRAMASGENWESMVPEAVAKYIKSNHLDVRFRKEFGLQALASETLIQ